MGNAFYPTRLKKRIANAGSPISGWDFLTPEEKARLQEKAAYKRALTRDDGRADAKLRKF